MVIQRFSLFSGLRFARWLVWFAWLSFAVVLGAVTSGMAFATSQSVDSDATGAKLSALSNPDAEIPISIAHTKLELGEAATLVVRGSVYVRAFNQLALEEWREHFVFDQQESASDRLRIRLYPLHTGEFRLPEIRLADAVLPAQSILVAENPHIQLDWLPVAFEGYSQESITQQVILSTTERDWRAEWASPIVHSSNINAWQVDRGANTSAASLDENEARFAQIYTFNGFIPPLGSVLQQLPTLHLKVRRSNGRYWHFFSPKTEYRVKALPSFLPAGTLVGKLAVESSFLQMVSAYQDVNYWRWRFSVTNSQVSYLRSAANQMLQQLSDVEGVEWLSAEFNAQQTLGAAGVEDSLEVLIPFRPQQWIWSQPSLEVQFFNPETQKVQRIELASAWHFSLPSWILWLFWVGMLLAGWWLLLIAACLFKRQFLWYQLIGRLQAASHPQDAIQALFSWQAQQISGCPKGDNTHRISVIGDWYRFYVMRATSGQARVLAERLCESLDRALYSKEGVEAGDWREAAQAWVQTESGWKLNSLQLPACLNSVTFWRISRRKV